MPIPNDKPAVCLLLGMINHLVPHIPNMESICTPPCHIIKTDVHFQWTTATQNALNQIKDILSTAPVLQYFGCAIVSVIQADATQHSLGACLMQHGKPVAYASRCLSTCKCNYAYNY